MSEEWVSDQHMHKEKGNTISPSGDSGPIWVGRKIPEPMEIAPVSEQQEALAEVLYSRKEKAVRMYYTERPSWEKVYREIEFNRYVPASRGNRNLIGLKVDFNCKKCGIHFVREYQTDLNDHHYHFWSCIRATGRHLFPCMQNMGNFKKLHEMCGCGGYPSVYSPNCDDDMHRPAIPDERIPETIVAYKTTRLGYIAKYLTLNYGEGDWYWELLQKEIRPTLDVSHTHMFTLPVLYSGTGSPVLPDLEVSCTLCPKKMNVSEYQAHLDGHANRRKERIMEILTTPIASLPDLPSVKALKAFQSRPVGGPRTFGWLLKKTGFERNRLRITLRNLVINGKIEELGMEKWRLARAKGGRRR